MKLSPRNALIVFITLVVFVVAQAVWWIVFMAKLVDEKVEIAEKLGATAEYLDQIHQKEISNQIMLGLEGVFFLIMILLGIFLIYRALSRTEELQFHQRNFLLSVTHELKTPLTSMKIYLDSLASEKIPLEKKMTIVPRMKDDVKRLEKLVENILEAGRFERGGYKTNMEILNFSELVRESVEIINRQASKIPFSIESAIEDEIKIYGDRIALSQAINAILENCLKYHNKNEILISLSLRRKSNNILLSISDNGIGIEKENLSKIFERFYRVGDEMTRIAEGTGLGLYLCHEIISAHNGTVKAYSGGPGNGSTFEIVLKGDVN